MIYRDAPCVIEITSNDRRPAVRLRTAKVFDGGFIVRCHDPLTCRFGWHHYTAAGQPTFLGSTAAEALELFGCDYW
jgi:hypothetical protein